MPLQFNINHKGTDTMNKTPAKTASKGTSKPKSGKPTTSKAPEPKAASTTANDNKRVVLAFDPFNPDFVTKIIDAVAMNIATESKGRKAFAKIVKHHSNGKVFVLTDKELARIIKKHTKA